MSGNPASVDRNVELILEKQRASLAQLMRSDAIATGDTTRAIREATEAATRLLSVRRASVWRFDEGRTRIDCVDLFDAGDGSHAGGTSLSAAAAPAYFAAVAGERTLAANDAHTDPRTCELAASYLAPLGIGALLDAPVFVHGRLAGVVCHEHVGPARRWEPWEELVAGTLADFVGMVLGAAVHAQQARELEVLRGNLEKLVDVRTRELQASQATVRKLFETSPVGLVVTRVNDQIVQFTNPRAATLFGVDLETAAGRSAPDFWVRPQDRLALVDEVKRTGRHDGLEAELKRLDGTRFWGLISAAVLDIDGVASLLVGVLDITEKKRAEATLLREQEAMRTMLEAAPIPLVVTGLDDAVVRFANARAADMFGTTLDELVGGRAPDFYANPDDRLAFVKALRTTGRVDAFAARLRTVDGKPFWSLLSARTFELDGTRVFMVGFADLTAQKEVEDRLRDLAELDGLTGAYNRRHFFDVATTTLTRSVARGTPLCVAMIDVDHFKRINDELGHALGDEALRLLTGVCRRASRASDVLARYGGEEFVLLLDHADVGVARSVVERIRAGLAATPLPTSRTDTYLTVSIGVAQLRAGEGLDDVLRRADAALYEAKRAGRDRVVVADPELVR